MSVFPHPNDPHGFTPQCTACDDNGCDLCCPTIPVTLEDLDDMPFPTDTPHVIANANAARDPDDKGACYLERIDADRIIVTVRSPREARESKVSIPFNIWLQLIADHRPPGSVNGEMLAALKSAYDLYQSAPFPQWPWLRLRCFRAEELEFSVLPSPVISIRFSAWWPSEQPWTSLSVPPSTSSGTPT